MSKSSFDLPDSDVIRINPPAARVTETHTHYDPMHQMSAVPIMEKATLFHAPDMIYDAAHTQSQGFKFKQIAPDVVRENKNMGVQFAHTAEVHAGEILDKVQLDAEKMVLPIKVENKKEKNGLDLYRVALP
jgi:hypothetical protein